MDGASVRLRHVTPSSEHAVVELMAPNNRGSPLDPAVLHRRGRQPVLRTASDRTGDRRCDPRRPQRRSDPPTRRAPRRTPRQCDLGMRRPALAPEPHRRDQTGLHHTYSTRTRTRRSTHERAGTPRPRARSVSTAPGHPPRPRRGTPTIRPAGLPGSARLQRQPVRRPLVREDAHLSLRE